MGSSTFVLFSGVFLDLNNSGLSRFSGFSSTKFRVLPGQKGISYTRSILQICFFSEISYSVVVREWLHISSCCLVQPLVLVHQVTLIHDGEVVV